MQDRVTESFFGVGVLGERLVVQDGMGKPKQKYLLYHRAHVFERVG